MATTDTTPLWLDLRKEYIDDNFDKLLVYLQNKKATHDNDAFYGVTITLLRERVEDLVNNLSTRPIYLEDEAADDPSFNVRLLALYLLVDESHPLAMPAFLAFLGELRLLHPRRSNMLLEMAMLRLRHERVATLGFAWQDLKNVKTEFFLVKFCNETKFESPLPRPAIFSKYGTAILTSMGLYLTHENEEVAMKLLKSGASSLDTGVGIVLRTASSGKMKVSDANNIVRMNEYTKDFIYEMYLVKEQKTVRRLSVYGENDEVLVRVTRIDPSGTIHVATIDPRYERVEGIIKFGMKSLMYYYTDTLFRYFREGDCFMASITSVADATFCIDERLVAYMVERTRQYEGVSDDFLCQLIDVKYNFMAWLNEYGVCMYTAHNDEFCKGDYAFLKVDRYGTGREFGKIYAEVIQGTDEYDYDDREIKEACIRGFAEQTQIPASVMAENRTGAISPVVLRILLRQLFLHQKSLLKPSERYRFLANAQVMAELVGDELSASYINFASTYLSVLVQFVCNEDFHSVRLEVEPEYKEATSTLIRLSVVQLLKEYGKKENSEVLAHAIEDYQEKYPILARLARLIQTANSMQGTLSDAAVNVIRREIIRTLSLETENDADLEADSGQYLGIESGTQEFKRSMVYSATGNMKPDEFAQNINVLKGVCAFLNSTTGGTLYLGVNDQGYVTGVASDMNYLHYQTMDSYLRYVQDVAKKHLGLDSLPYLRIEPLYDDTVVAIHVEPHPYRVVELLNTAYLRVNAESREMPERLRQELIARKMLTNKNAAAAISQLQHACSQERCVMLHNYASSNSGSLKDRLVEAYSILPEEGLIMCYDRDTTSEKKIKVFSISRIGYVEIRENEPWKYKALHLPIEVDAFHMTGDRKLHVSLQLDLFSKNLLVEEYPGTKGDVKMHKGDENIWYFDAKVCRIEPVARFYIGLADRIKILDCPELKAYVKDFVSKNLSE